MKKRISALLLTVLCMALLATPAFAYARVDENAKTSLTLTYKDGEKAIKEMEMKAYKVLDTSDAVVFTVETAFTGYGAIMDLLDVTKWPDTANELSNKLKMDTAITPVTATTDENGVVTFADLEVGVYLIAGEAVREGRYTYTPQSFMVTLPLLDANDEWQYDAAGDGKGSGITGNPPYNPPKDPEPEVIPDAPVSGEPDAPGDLEEPPDKEVPDDELPQTGLLQWPVPVMTAAGLALTLIGVICGHKEKELESHERK